MRWGLRGWAAGRAGWADRPRLSEENAGLPTQPGRPAPTERRPQVGPPGRVHSGWSAATRRSRVAGPCAKGVQGLPLVKAAGGSPAATRPGGGTALCEDCVPYASSRPGPLQTQKTLPSLGFKCLPQPPSAARPHVKALCGSARCEVASLSAGVEPPHSLSGQRPAAEEPGGPRQSLGSVRALPTTPEGWALTSPSQTRRLPLPHRLRPSNPKVPSAFLPKLPQGGR